MPSRSDSREETSPRNDNTQGEPCSAPEQQYSETDLSSDGPTPPQRAGNHPHRAYRVCDTDASHPSGPYLSTEQVKRAVHTQGFLPCESGISPDGCPNRSAEEGGVSGLFSQCESNQYSESSTSSDIPSSSSSGSRSTESSTSDVYDGSVHTARAVPLRRLRLGRPQDERPGENRLPSPAALDRIDDAIEDSERTWTDYPLGAARQTRESGENEAGRLTGGREMSTSPRHSRAPNLMGVGQRGTTPPSRPHHTRGSASHHTGRASEYHSASSHHTQLQHIFPAPNSTTDTAFNLQPGAYSPRTPPQPQSDRALLPSQRQQAAVAAAGSSRGLTRGPSYPAPVVAQDEREAVPAVLVPGGRFGLGGSHPRLPPQSSRRQGDGRSGEDEERKGREWRKKER